MKTKTDPSKSPSIAILPQLLTAQASLEIAAQHFEDSQSDADPSERRHLEEMEDFVVAAIKQLEACIYEATHR